MALHKDNKMDVLINGKIELRSYNYSDKKDFMQQIRERPIINQNEEIKWISNSEIPIISIGV